MDRLTVISTASPPPTAADTAINPAMEPTFAMTAEALLCRQYLGWKRDDPRLRRA